MPHNAIAVANRLIDLAEEDGNQLTNLQVIKLVYFCHAWMLGLYERPLIEQPIEAWRFGPVIRDVYQSFKNHRGEPIQAKAGVPAANFDDKEEDLIRQVYRKYGYLSGIRLSELTHEEGTPWHKVWRRNGQDSIIPRSLMQEYYSKQASEPNG
jgi:uncharacterized phage-associated protein